MIVLMFVKQIINVGVSQVTKNTTNCYTLSNLVNLNLHQLKPILGKTTHYQKEYGNYTIHGEVNCASDPTHKAHFVVQKFEWSL